MDAFDRKIYEQCKMDCFHCPFDDCILSDKAALDPPKTEEQKKITAQKIAELRKDGKSYVQIGKILNMDKMTVRRWFLKYVER